MRSTSTEIGAGVVAGVVSGAVVLGIVNHLIAAVPEVWYGADRNVLWDGVPTEALYGAVIGIVVGITFPLVARAVVFHALHFLVVLIAVFAITAIYPMESLPEGVRLVSLLDKSAALPGFLAFVFTGMTFLLQPKVANALEADQH